MITKAIKILQDYEPQEGYYVAFSGGKDSCVIYDLVKRANVKHDVNHSITTLDPPELMKWMKKAYPEVIRHKPEMNMYQWVTKKKSLPTRIGRWCCEKLKEGGGNGRMVVLGIRAEESNSRKNKPMFEWDGKKIRFNIIIDWTELDIWNYIDKFNVPYSPLYDNGKSRIGCIGCPMLGGKRMKIEFQQYPNVKRNYIKAINKAIDQGGFKRFQDANCDGNNIFNWWVSGLSVKVFLEMNNQVELNLSNHRAETQDNTKPRFSALS